MFFRGHGKFGDAAIWVGNNIGDNGISRGTITDSNDFIFSELWRVPILGHVIIRNALNLFSGRQTLHLSDL